MQPASALIIVAKHPTPGQTKTRLSPPLTVSQAAALYECFLLDTLDLARQVEGVQCILAYLPAGEEAYFRQVAPDFELALQTGADLGERLDNLTTDYLSQGYQKVVVVDSDSPSLPVENLRAAFQQLDDSTDVVIGPCDDGGYYLIGLKRPAPRLLRDVRMSTPSVTADTLVLAAGEGLRALLLPHGYDVDDAAGMERLRAELIHLPLSIARHTRRFFQKTPVRK